MQKRFMGIKYTRFTYNLRILRIHIHVQLNSAVVVYFHWWTELPGSGIWQWGVAVVMRSV